MTRVATAAVNDEAKVKVCRGHTRPICHINYSEIVDGTFWFITSCHDSKPMLRNGETGDWVGTFEGHKGAVYCSSFNKDATKVVTGSGDYTAVMWDALKGTRLHTWEHPHYIKSCDWVDTKVATGNYDSKVRIFDITNYNSEPIVINAHEKPTVKAVYFCEDTNSVVSACEDRVLKWDLRSGQVVAKKDIPGLNVLEYTHRHTLVAAHGKSISFLNPENLLEARPTINTMEDVECASLSPCGTRLAAGSKIKVKEFAQDGTELQTHRGHHGPIFHVRWAPDGQSFASGAEDGMVRVWPTNEILQKYQTN